MHYGSFNIAYHFVKPVYDLLVFYWRQYFADIRQAQTDVFLMITRHYAFDQSFVRAWQVTGGEFWQYPAALSKMALQEKYWFGDHKW